MTFNVYLSMYNYIDNAGDTIVQQTCDFALNNLRRAREALTAQVLLAENLLEHHLF